MRFYGLKRCLLTTEEQKSENITEALEKMISQLNEIQKAVERQQKGPGDSSPLAIFRYYARRLRMIKNNNLVQSLEEANLFE